MITSLITPKNTEELLTYLYYYYYCLRPIIITFIYFILLLVDKIYSRYTINIYNDGNIYFVRHINCIVAVSDIPRWL